MFAHPVVVVLTIVTAMLTSTRLYRPSWIHTNWIFHGSSLAICSQLWIITASSPMNQVALTMTLICAATLLIAIFTRHFLLLAASTCITAIYFFSLYLSGPVMQAIHIHIALACLLMANCVVGVLQITHLVLQHHRLQQARPPLPNIPPLETLKTHIRYTGAIGFCLVSAVVISCIHQFDHHLPLAQRYFNVILTLFAWSALGIVVWHPASRKSIILPLLATVSLAAISISCLLTRM